MNSETVQTILFYANSAVPQWVMVWNSKLQRFQLYKNREENQ